MELDGLIEHLGDATVTALLAAAGTDTWTALRARLGGVLGAASRRPLAHAVDEAARELSSVPAGRRHEVEDHHRRLLLEGLRPAVRDGALTAVDLLDLLDILVRQFSGTGAQHACAFDSAQQSVQFSGEQSNRFDR